MKRVSRRPENSHQARLLCLLRDGSRSRAELGEIFELSRSKLNAELDQLIDMGLVEQAGLAASRGGRRSGMVRLASHLRFAGIDIGATSVDVAVTNGELEILGHLGQPCDVRQGPMVVLEQAVTLLGKLRDQGLYNTLHGVGVGVPGPVSFREGLPVAPPIMPGWDRYPVREAISQVLRCPAVVDNDVNLMAMGERQSGLARHADDFLLVKMGTGIGCGVVVGGKLYRGVSGSAGDIGHIRVTEQGPTCSCGNAGCLEAYSGGAALAAEAVRIAPRSPYLAERLTQKGTLTVRDIGTAAALGDAAAVGLIRDAGRHMGRVLASLVSFFNPGLVIIAGGVAKLGHVLLAEIRGVVYRRSLPLATGNLPIVLSELGDTAGVIGGARLISDHAFSAS